MQRTASGQQGPFHAIVAQPAGLQTVLAFAAAQFSDVVALQLTSEGLRLQAVDSAQSAFLDAQFASTGSDSIFRSWVLAPPYLALHLHPKSLANLLAASNPAGTLLSQLSLAVGAQSDRLSVGVSSLGKHGVALRACYDVALLSAEGQAEIVEVSAADFTFTAQLLCTLPAILADAVGSLKSAGCQEVRLTLRPGSESGRRPSSVSFESCGPELPINCCITLEEPSEGGKLALAVDAACSASFHFKWARFFERLAALSKVSSSVLLQLGPEAPLSVVCQLNGGGYCRLFLAPVVEDDRMS
ncbi:hypothetical protein ABPG75_009683 [Micractinium tetrahymenae]